MRVIFVVCISPLHAERTGRKYHLCNLFFPKRILKKQHSKCSLLAGGEKISLKKWRPYRESNPSYLREREVS